MVAALLAACSGEDSARPSTLMDGSEVGTPTVELDGVSEPAALTKVAVVDVEQEPAGSASATCVAVHDLAESPRRVVERVGVVGSTVTFATESGVYGCDDTPGAREGGRRWCGTSFGELTAGKLEDPRLDIAGCVTSSGLPTGFAWIELSPETRYVAVAQDGYVEVYVPAGSLPIRVATTTGVQIEGSRARFELTEHDASGALLRRYELQVAAAG